MTQKFPSLIVSLLTLGALPLCLQAQTTTTTTTAAPAPAAATAPVVAAPAAPTSSWTFTPSVVSQYMFRGVRLGGLSFEPAIEFDYDNIGLGVWMNFPLANKVDGVSDPEIDPYGYYTIAINDSFSVVPGFTWYTYPRADSSVGFYKATFEPNVAFNYTVGGVKFTPKFYYDLFLEGPTYELTVAWALPLKNLGTELDFTGTIGTYKWKKAAENTYPDVHNYGDYWLLGVSAPYAINSSSKIIVGFAYTQGNNNFYHQTGSPKVENTTAVGRGVVTVSYAITF